MGSSPHAASEGLDIDRAAREGGRDPRVIRRIYNVPGQFARAAEAPGTDDDQAIVGPLEHWAEIITHLAFDLGFSTFVLAIPPDPCTLTAFIEGVAPTVRERVAEQRASSSTPEGKRR